MTTESTLTRATTKEDPRLKPHCKHDQLKDFTAILLKEQLLH